MLCGSNRPRIFALFFILWAGAASAQEPAKIDVEATELTAELIGRPVFAIGGEEVGTVTDLLLDDSGLPQKLRFTAGTHLGIGGRTLEVPSSAFITLRGAAVLDFPAADVAFLSEAHDGDEDR